MMPQKAGRLYVSYTDDLICAYSVPLSPTHTTELSVCGQGVPHSTSWLGRRGGHLVIVKVFHTFRTCLNAPLPLCELVVG